MPATSIHLTAGDKAPDFALTDQSGKRVALADFAGSKLIVFVYPAALTPGCTKEACDFRDNVAILKRVGYRLVGLSKDPVEKQSTFATTHNLSYPLLSDPDLATISAFGAYGEKNLYGKKHLGVIRSTFVIDENSHIIHALYNVKATGHVARLVRLLGIG